MTAACRMSAISLLLLAGAAHAADIKVLTTGAVKPVLLAIQPDFEAKTGDHLLIENDTAGVVIKRVAAGEKFDVLIASHAGIADLLKSGKLSSGSDIARVGIGVAVKSGTKLPDISTLASFKATLLAAKSVTYIDPASGGSSGIYLAGLFERMGISPQIKAKSVLAQGGVSGDKVVDGTAEIALQQISELMTVKGATVVGPIPAEVQNYTTYGAGEVVGSNVSGEAGKLLAALHGPSFAKALAAKGMAAAE